MHASNKKNSNHLASVYNYMMLAIRNAFETEDNSDFSLQKTLNQAKGELVRLDEVSRDEAQEVCDYIKRDINESAEYMMESSEDFCDWLMLDIEVVEHKVVDLFISAADKTRFEIEQLNGSRQSASYYRMGEITGFGTLQCTSCNELISFTTTTVIKACEHCGNTRFIRADIKRLK